MAKEPEHLGNKKPKLSNQPTPKSPKKAKPSFLRKLFGLLFVGVIVFALVTMKMHSDATGRAPWNWSGEDWTGYLTLSRQVAEENVNKARERFEQIDWEAVKGKITEKTKDLWRQLSEVEDKIEKRLAEQREERGAPAEEAPDSAADPGPASPTPASAKAPPKPKSSYEKGLEAMRDAVRLYRDAPPGSNAGLDKSMGAFRKAQDHFEKAIEEVPEERKPEIESMMQECQQYIYDCQKRKTL